MLKVKKGGGEEIPLIQGKEQWLCFAGTAVKRYPASKVGGATREVTPRPRSGAAGGRSYPILLRPRPRTAAGRSNPVLEARGGGRED